jgi:hypothetical protein
MRRSAKDGVEWCMLQRRKVNMTRKENREENNEKDKLLL